MIRATTPTHRFIFDQNPELFERILITYAQNGRIVLEKEKEDLTFEEPTEGQYPAYVQLTQEETNLFKASTVTVQVRVLTTGGDVLASEKKSIGVENVLNDEVLE